MNKNIFRKKSPMKNRCLKGYFLLRKLIINLKLYNILNRKKNTLKCEKISNFQIFVQLFKLNVSQC